MPGFSIIMDGDSCWPELKDKDVVLVDNESLIQVAVLKEGMQSGRPSITIRMELPDGRVVLGETSARLFVMAGRMIDAKFPNLFRDN